VGNIIGDFSILTSNKSTQRLLQYLSRLTCTIISWLITPIYVGFILCSYYLSI